MSDLVYLKVRGSYLGWSPADKQYVTTSKERASKFSRSDAEEVVSSGFSTAVIEEID